MTDKHNPDKAMAGMLKRKGVWPFATDGEACPDAATLAAYFERSLTPAEVSLWETHFSSCARCQEQLATLVRSDPASQVKSAEAKKPAFSWLWDWRFVAPVGAVAVAFVFFISYQTMRAPAARQGDAELMARRDVTAQAPAISEPQKSVDSAAAKQLEKGRSASDEFQSKKSNAAAEAAKAEHSLKDKSAAKSPAIVADAVSSRVPAKPAEESQLAAAAGRVAPTQPAPAVSGGIVQPETAKTQQQIVEADRAQAAPAPPQAGAPSTQALQKQDRPAVVAESKERSATPPTEGQLQEQKAAGKQEGVAAMQAPARGERSRTADARFALEASPKSLSKFLNAPGEFMVTTPNPKVLWRFGPSGLIERSRDAGKNWERQKSPEQETFLSGSAPSEKICWVGGKNGVLLRTMDGGENWERIPSPTQSDIGTVKARDLFHVTVVDADGRAYETPNAGRLWRTP